MSAGCPCDGAGTVPYQPHPTNHTDSTSMNLIFLTKNKMVKNSKKMGGGFLVQIETLTSWLESYMEHKQNLDCMIGFVLHRRENDGSKEI